MSAIPLAIRTFGDDGPLVIFVHGLLGQGRNWQVIAKRLAVDRRVVTADLRNHGQSPWDPVMTYAAMADDLAALIAQEGQASAALIGHSMGGKVAMVLALLRPDLVERLAVIDIAPVAYQHGEYVTYMSAMLAVDVSAMSRRSAVEAALGEVDPDPRIRAFLASNADGPAGQLRWLPNLEVLRRSLPELLGFPDLPGAYHGRSLFLSGAKSNYVRPEHRPLIERWFPGAGRVAIPDAAHWVHADQPQLVIDELDRFLDEEGPLYSEPL